MRCAVGAARSRARRCGERVGTSSERRLFAACLLVFLAAAASCAPARRPEPPPDLARASGVAPASPLPTTPAQPLATRAPAGAPEGAAANLYLWRVAHGERPGTASILGSIHVGAAEGPRFDRAIADAFEHSSRMAVEVDMTTLSDGKGLFAVMRAYGFYPEGQTLSQALDEPLRGRVQAKLAAIGFDPAMADRLRPWFVYFLLTTMPVANGDLSFARGIDMVLLGAAARAEKPVLSLETFEEQIAALASAPEPLQIRLLGEALDRSTAPGPSMRDMLVAYEAGDDETLLRNVQQAAVDAELTAYYDRLIRQRNETMADSIDRELATPGDLLVVVGALHLLGEQSVLTELKARGYSIERIAPTGERVTLPLPSPSPRPRPVVGHDIDLPSPVHQRSDPLPNGAVLESQTASDGRIGYVATMQKVREMSDQPMSSFFFDAAEYGIVQSIQGEVVQREDISVDGLPARVTTVRSPTSWARILLVRGDDEIFLVLAVATGAGEPDESTRRRVDGVLASFHPRFDD